MKEMWKPIFGGVYSVSDEGDVMRVKRGRGAMAGKCLAHPLDSSGYPNLSFCVDGKQNQLRLYNVVAMLFLGERPAGTEINHKDGNKTNCAASNLEYVSKSENVQHAHDAGLIRKPGKRSRLTKTDVGTIREMRATGESQGNIAKQFGIDQGHVSAIVNRKIWRSV
jgi:hypothetical protein